MMNRSEAKELAHSILINIEKNSKDLHLLCLQTSRLALLLNNTTKSKSFSHDANNCSKMEAFIASYGLIIDDLKNMYEIESNNLYERKLKEIDKLLASLNFNSTQRDPIKDIEKFYLYKQNLDDIKSRIYEYALDTHYQLIFSENIVDIFGEYESVMNNQLPEIMPDSREKLDSITKNLNSQNPEDWSNAVHTCRKLLQSLADNLYPSSKESIKKNGIEIKVGEKDYINRLINFIDDNQESKKYKAIVGSNLKFIGERLDAVYESSNKGSHQTIATIEEAKRYVIHTYLFLGDVLQIKGGKQRP